MRSVMKYLVFLILPVVLVVLWLAGLFHPKISAREIETAAKEVKGVEIGIVEALKRSEVSFAGTVVPSDRAEVSTRRMGFISFVGVEEGDYVRKGDLLLRIDPRDVKAQVEVARQRVVQAQKSYASALANYEAAKKTYERYKELLKEGAVTRHEFDMVEARYEAAKASVEAARSSIELARRSLELVSANLSYVEIKAPFSGYVVRRLVDVGDMARPGHPLLVMEKPPYRVEVSLPESMYAYVKPGDRIRVSVPALGKELYARVVEVEPSVDPRSRTFRLEAVLEDRNVRGGFFAKVYIGKPVKKTLLVPVGAIYRKWDFTGVWVLREDGTLTLRFVRLGRRVGDKVEVLSGLEEGERIVVKGVNKACEGCKVGG